MEFDWHCDTFVASTKEDSSSHSSSSWDLVSEFVFSSAIFYEGMSDFQLKKDYFALEQQEDQYGSYDKLLKKFIQKEEELRFSNYKLEQSEEEVTKLEIQIKQCEGQLNDVLKELKRKESYIEQCEVDLDDLQRELKVKEDDLEYEQGQILEMQKQKVDLVILVQDSCYKITKFEELLKAAAEQLEISSNEIERLTKELESNLYETQELQGQLKVFEECVAKLEGEFDSGRKQIQDLEERITWLKDNETNNELEVQKLKDEMADAWIEFSLEKDELQIDIASLSETNMDLTSRLKEWEERSNAYEKKLRQYEVANLKLKELHAAQQMALQGEINALKEEVGRYFSFFES